MSQDRAQHPPDPIVSAIQSVLEAERAAEQKLADCRRQANAAVADARDQAAAIGRRTDTRISKLHTAYLQKVETHTTQLSHSSGTAAEVADERRQTSLYDDAARRLAAKLTSDVGEATR